MANCKNISLKTAILFNQYISNIALPTFQISTLSSRSSNIWELGTVVGLNRAITTVVEKNKTHFVKKGQSAKAKMWKLKIANRSKSATGIDHIKIFLNCDWLKNLQQPITTLKMSLAWKFLYRIRPT